MPKPKEGESQDDFIGRCMGNDTMVQEFPDEKQRVAVCYQIWRDKDKKRQGIEEIDKRMFVFDVENREEDNAELVGHAAVFDTFANIMWWQEKIERGAFRETIAKDDIRALFNHDPNLVLGRNKNGTLFLEEDEKGLFVRIKPPDTSIGRDVVKLIKRGDVTQMSFAFVIPSDGEEWIDGRGESDKRIIKRVRLYDVSPVTFPAYEQTDISLRSYRAWRNAMESFSRNESPRFVKRDLYDKRLKLRKRR